MEFSSFLENNKNKQNSQSSNAPGGKDVDFLKGVDEKDLGPAPKKSSNLGKAPKRSAQGRLNDMLISGSSQGGQDDLQTNKQAQKSPDTGQNDNKDNNDNKEKQQPADRYPKKEPKKGFWSFLDKFKKSSANNQSFLSKGGKDTLEVNLVKDEIIKFFDWQKAILVLLLSIFISLFLISLAYWGVSWWGIQKQYEKDKLLTTDYNRIRQQIRELEPEIEEVTAFQSKLDKINFLLDRHIYWTNFFDFLERNTLADVYFSGFSGGTGGTYKLSGKARHFEVLDAQVKKFLADENVTSASISGGSASISNEDDITGVSFDITFTVDPDIFYK
ncbi:hypothetical protein GF382_00050 [Candidatus Falkowbacteria bacterium]|nr:hypothetical protein [Candidatus Falkowbacteria bacterium]